MADIINKPLAILRKPDSSKPLHSRWGDTSISVPTDGSWNQSANQHRHRPVPSRQTYRPGLKSQPSPSDRPSKESRHGYDVDHKSASTHSTSASRRNSMSLGTLRPNRLSVRLASRPKHLRGESLEERRDSHPTPKKAEFAYKPIYQDYATEAAEHAHTARYRYIPTNGRYLEDVSNTAPRGQPRDSERSIRSRGDSVTESLGYKPRCRESPLLSRNSHHDDDRQNRRSCLGNTSDNPSSSPGLSGFGQASRRKTTAHVAADRRRFSLKPVTLSMVPDPDELYE